MKETPEPKVTTIAETENNMVWSAEEPDGETTYYVQIDNVTINFFQEEWDEFKQLIKMLA